MAKIDLNFPHDMFQFLHRPLRVADKEQGDSFLERFLLGPQKIFEDTVKKLNELSTLNNPAKIRADLLLFLKDHVGFTKELDNITQGLTESDLRKLISLAVALWKEKGTEPGYQNIVRLFTGKSVRVYNWFDFRLIVGEKAFGEEQLGEDSWLISVPGVELSQDPSNNVVSLLTFEDNFKDRSLTRNHALGSGAFSFYQTPSSGFPQGSKKYLNLQGGVVTQPHSSKYDFSGNFTIELFFRTPIAQSSRTLFHKMDSSGKGIRINIDTVSNSLSFILNDGVNTVSDSFTPTQNLDDGQVHHLALVVNRSLGARLYVGGTEASPLQSVSTLGDVSNFSQIIYGGASVISNNFLGDLDNVRIALNSVYTVTSPTLTPPMSGFIEYMEEQLDEFFSDIRIVDEGDLNKILMLRILNLMRPSSERLNAIFIKFFEDFEAGSGRFNNLTGTSKVNTNTQLEVDPNSIAATDVLNDSEFKNIVLQVKANDKDIGGGIFGVLFFVQNLNSYYELRINTIDREVSLFKCVSGVFTQIGASQTVDIVPKASYIFTIITSFNPLTSDTLLQTLVDSNRIHQVLDSSFEKGKFGFKAGPSTTMQISEIEMFTYPLDVQKVLPGFAL